MLSRETSGAISQFVANILGGGSGSGEQEHYFVRKMAHFVEFTMLGAVSCLFFDSSISNARRRYTVVALVGVSVPIIDETIQIFSKRGPAIADALIDMAGYAFGTLTVVALLLIVRRHFSGRENTE